MKSWKKIGLGLFLALLFPYVTTLFLSGQVIEPETELSYSGKMVELEGEVIDGEQFLIYVLAAQIPADYEAEALKAQAVLCRTNLYQGLEAGISTAEDLAEEYGLSYLTLQDMKKRWQERFSDCYRCMEQAVAQTACQTVTYGGSYIEAFWHGASAGKTRSGGEAYPYLTSVESNDIDMENYLTIRTLSNEEMAKALKDAGAGAVTAEGLNRTIQVGSRDEAGYVLSLEMGGLSLKGADFAEALGLPSESFTVEQQDQGLKFICTGAGSGYGLSQWGAVRMAQQGSTYEEILSYYLEEIEIRSDL